jgi:hypothetical protein
MHTARRPLTFSVGTLLLVMLYAALVCTVFVFSNLWIGTLIVAVTAVYLSIVTAKAVATQSRFCLAFAITGWSWVVLWFGFMAQSDVNTPNWPVPGWIAAAKSPFYDTSDSLPDNRGKFHSLWFTTEFRGGPVVPSYFNWIRFVVCTTAIFVGTIVGAGCQFLWPLRLTRGEP